jgi:hypothetical protein
MVARLSTKEERGYEKKLLGGPRKVRQRLRKLMNKDANLDKC